ncbi:MAG TPA: hypothetical protein V6C57_10855 [Coleofasciculaceae cyanobacterium]
MTTERLAKIPPLESGDRLSRSEFERRYHAMPHLKKVAGAPVAQWVQGGPAQKAEQCCPEIFA